MKTLGRQNINVYNSWKIFCNWFQHSRHDPLPLLQLSPGQTNSIEYLIDWNLFSLLVNQQGTTQPENYLGLSECGANGQMVHPSPPFSLMVWTKLRSLQKWEMKYRKTPCESDHSVLCNKIAWHVPIHPVHNLRNSFRIDYHHHVQLLLLFKMLLTNWQRLQFSWMASTFAELWPQQEKQCWQGPLPLHPPSHSSYWAPPPIQPLPRAVIFRDSDIWGFCQISIEQIHSCLRKLTASISMHVFQPGVWFTPALLQKIFTCIVFLAAFLCFITWFPKIIHLRYLVIEVSLTSKV